MRATEFIVEGVTEGKLNEIRDQLWTWVQSKFPRTQWPEYVQRDFLYQQAKGIRNQAELDDFLKRNRNDFGKVQWRLEKLPITMDIFTPKTQRMILSREGGSSNPFQVPRDAERHAQQLKIIQQKGVSEEPIIVAKLSNGYDLIEGWHRTIQHLKEFPQGYTAPAWVGYGATYTSESVEQGVAEGLDEAVGDNYLYHATMPAGIMRILRTGAIKATDRPQPSTKARTQYPTISTTRSKQYAESNEFVDFLNLTKEGNAVILVFDRNAVANHYKMFGTSQGTQTVGDEYEEVIVAPKGSMPIKGTLKGFYFNPKRTSEIQEYQDVPWFKELLNSPYYMGQEQAVAEGLFDRFKKKLTANIGGIDLTASKEGGRIIIDASSQGKQLGIVMFNINGKTLVADRLMVQPEYRGQGIAEIMYDWAKGLGYTVQRSSDQTDDGKRFWDKLKGEETNVWEQDVAEGT
jgi:GNAT superfamily N-acetyltransferase